MQESYGTLSETINGLKKDGYTLDFNIKEECVICDQQNISLSPEEFEIDKVYRFEGDANPEDQSILYAISSSKFKLKGVLVNGYGISSDEKSNAVISKLRTPTASTTKNELTENIEVDIKTNVATPLRPEGDRVLDALFVEMDLNNFIEQLKNEVTWASTDRNSITVFKSDNTTIVLIGLHKNAEMKEHHAKGNIHVQILEGKIKFNTEEQTTVLIKGKMVALKAKIPHSVIAIEESFFLLTMIVIP